MNCNKVDWREAKSHKGASLKARTSIREEVKEEGANLRAPTPQEEPAKTDGNLRENTQKHQSKPENLCRGQEPSKKKIEQASGYRGKRVATS